MKLRAAGNHAPVVASLSARGLLGRYTGIFRGLDRLPLRAYDPDIHLWAGTVAARGKQRGDFIVGGAGWSDEEAWLACVGEGIERCEAHSIADDELFEGTYDDVRRRGRAVHPADWVLFDRRQYARDGFPFHPLTESTRCAWLRFRDVSQGEAVWVPEDLATLAPSSGEHRFAQMTSTGLSAGTLGQPIVLRGAEEVVERDALVLSWWGTYPIRLLDEREVWGILGDELRARAIRRHLRYAFYTIDTPYSRNVTVATTLGEEREGPILSTGSACRETMRASLQKSLLEALQGRHYVRHLMATNVPDVARPPSDFSEHATYYSRTPGLLARTPFAQATGPAKVEGSSAPESLATLAAALGAKHPILARLATPPFLSRLAPHFCVVRVVVPGLVPLHGNHQLAHLGGGHYPGDVADHEASLPHPYA